MNTLTLQPSPATWKKAPLCLLALALLCISPFQAIAAYSSNGGQSTAAGGFTGPGPGIMTVEQAKGMSDDSHVFLKGSLVQHIGGEKYLFKDATGTITVEIDNDVWQGQNIGPQDVIEIHGELDKELFSAEVEVDRVVKQ